MGVPELWFKLPAYHAFDMEERFSMALYWSFTTMIGYVGFQPVEETELGFTIGIMLIGVCVYLWLFGTLVNLLGAMDASAAKHKERMEGIKQYMNHRGLPK